jgi:N-acetylated-alpha-linked acidic dipeptidase
MVRHASSRLSSGYSVNLTKSLFLLASPVAAPLAVSVAMSLAGPSVLRAQGTSGAASSAGTIVGFGPTAAAAQRRFEAEVIATPQPSRARTHSQALSREPHVAGTPAQARTRDYVIAQMKAMGLETEIRTYDVWLPHATGVKVTLLGGAGTSDSGRDGTVLDLSEPPVPGDTVTSLPQYLTVNGYSVA